MRILSGFLLLAFLVVGIQQASAKDFRVVKERTSLNRIIYEIKCDNGKTRLVIYYKKHGKYGYPSQGGGVYKTLEIAGDIICEKT